MHRRGLERPEAHTAINAAEGIGLSSLPRGGRPAGSDTTIAIARQAVQTVCPIDRALGVSKDPVLAMQGAVFRNYLASAGAGSGTHMSAERFKFAAGIKAQHVAFKGQPEFIIELLAGRIHFASSGLTVALPFIREKKLIALVVNRPDRSPLLPDVPAAPEVVPGWGRDGSLAWLAPAGTPPAIRSKVSDAMKHALALSDIKERLENIGFTPAPTTPQDHETNLRADIEAFTRIGQQIGLRSK